MDTFGLDVGRCPTPRQGEVLPAPSARPKDVPKGERRSQTSKPPNFQTSFSPEEGLGGHGEIGLGGQGGVGGLDRGDEGGGVGRGGGKFLDVEEVGALGGDSLGAFGEVVG